MKFSVPFVILLLIGCNIFPAQAQNEISNATDPATQLKAMSQPLPPYPEEASKRRIEGKVALSIVVDANGNVTDAKVLSGPEELVGAALAAVSTWRYEPPHSAAVTKTVSISFGFPKDCPGELSDNGSVQWSWDLRDRDGSRIATIADNRTLPPPYPEAERKSGVAGTNVLSISLDPDGDVKDVHIVESLSPGLDKAVVDAVRALKFRILDGNASLEDLRLQFRFRPICSPVF